MIEPAADRDILAACSVLWEPGAVYELRVLNTAKGTVSGYFRDAAAFADHAATWSGQAPGVYQTLNPCKLELLARGPNRIEEHARVTTADVEILKRRWLPIDFDPVRPAGTSSSAAEHTASRRQAVDAAKFLMDLGVPRESIISADSGNGAHLLVRVDLPNDDASTQLVRRCLQALDLPFSNAEVTVDTTCYNAGRIWKVYGTLAAKGAEVDDRVHRIARLLQVPSQFTVCPREALLRWHDLMPLVEAPRPASVPGLPAFDVEDFIARNLPQLVAYTGMWQGARKWVLKECPFGIHDVDRGAVILQHPSGAADFRCQHAKCANNRWQELKALYRVALARGRGQSAARAPIPFRPPAVDKSEPPLTVVAREEPTDTDASPPDDRFTDRGNRDRFVKMFEGELLYVDTWNRWHCWNQKYFEPDSTREVMRRIDDALVNIKTEKGLTQEEDDKIFKHYLRSASRKAYENVEKMAQSAQAFATRLSELDANPWFFNCQNGTLNLQNGKLHAHRMADRITKCSPVIYKASAPCPIWEAALRVWMAGDEEMIAYLQRAVGYSLTGDTREQVLFFPWGPGANGKSVFLALIRHIVGDYSGTIRPEALLERPNDSGSHEIAELEGKRFIDTTEITEGGRLAEGLVKRLTGGDRLSASFKFGKQFSFQPQLKLWMAANHKPTIRGTDYAIWRRIHLIPFEVVIPEAQRDGDLVAKLIEEDSGILAWAVRGCASWQEHGLRAPQPVLEAVEAYRVNEDTVGRFIDECCERSEAYSVSSDRLYQGYTSWALDNGERARSKKWLGEQLDARHFEREKYNNRWYRQGLALQVEGGLT